jgi:predicted nucleotidyltransferase
MDKRTDIEKIKEIISGVLEAERISTFETYLFGSRARGDFSSSSDYDIMRMERGQASSWPTPVHTEKRRKKRLQEERPKNRRMKFVPGG